MRGMKRIKTAEFSSQVYRGGKSQDMEKGESADANPDRGQRHRLKSTRDGESHEHQEKRETTTNGGKR